jgi:hypothetical protein
MFKKNCRKSLIIPKAYQRLKNSRCVNSPLRWVRRGWRGVRGSGRTSRCGGTKVSTPGRSWPSCGSVVESVAVAAAAEAAAEGMMAALEGGGCSSTSRPGWCGTPASQLRRPRLASGVLRIKQTRGAEWEKCTGREHKRMGGGAAGLFYLLESCMRESCDTKWCNLDWATSLRFLNYRSAAYMSSTTRLTENDTFLINI